MDAIPGLASTWTGEVVAIGVDVALKATVLLSLAALVDVLLSWRRRVLARSALWNAALIGLLVLPAATLLLPRMRVRCLPAVETPARNGGTAAVAATRVDFASSARNASMLTAMADAYEQTVARPMEDDATVAAGESAGPVVPAVETTTVESRFDWVRLAGALYGGIALILLIRLVRDYTAIRRLRRSAWPVRDGPWIAAAERWCGELGLRRPVGLALSDQISVPVVIGWLRPMVLLPAGGDGAALTAHRDAILLHELAHVRRNDYAWRLLLRVAQMIYWPHPLIWWAGRAAESVREQACDQLCVYHAGGPGQYGAALLDVVRTLVSRPASSLGIAMARSSRIARRLERINRDRGHSACRSTRAVRACVVVSVLLAVGVLGPGELARRSGATAAASEKPGSAGPSAGPEKQRTETTAFGSVIERVVNDDGVRTNCVIDLDTGKLLTPPDVSGKDAVLRWARETGIDAVGEAGSSKLRLDGIDMVGIPVAAREWRDIKPWELRRRLSGRTPTELTPMAAGESLPATFLIETREGRAGILQILGRSEKPRGVRIRYKLLSPRPTTEPAPDSRPAATQRAMGDSRELSGAARTRATRPINVQRSGAFGFPQRDARVLCSLEELRVSVWNDAMHLYVQAVLWTDPDDGLRVGKDGREMGDWSHLLLDLDADQKATPNVDRVYSLNPLPTFHGIYYQIVLGTKMWTGLRDDSQGRGSIHLVGSHGAKRVRVDSYVIPLRELGKRPGQRVGVAYWGTSPPKKLIVNSVGYRADPGYWFWDLPMEKYHLVNLVNRAPTLDPEIVLEPKRANLSENRTTSKTR